MNDKPLIQKSPVREFADDLEDTLRKAEQFGVAWKGTRFAGYLRLWREAENRQYPVNLQGAEGDRLAEHLWEAASQAQQLIRSAPIWDEVKRDVLIEKLKKVFRGTESPPASGEDDEPRNILLELVTAGLLKYSGFDVDLPREGDVFAALPEADFVVECKRPASVKKLEASLKGIRRKLKERRWQHPDRKGVAVVGIDRLTGIVGRSPHTRDLGSLQSALERKAQQLTEEIVRLAPKTKLATQASFGCVILATAIFVESEKVLARAQQFSGFSLERGDRSPLANTFAAHFGGTIEID
jgi:hypothetical protein